ncbi:cytochrome-c oxidase [Brevibacillus daliensis]|uniref:cytochrome-c oxidase n=1 Tax=Brevibacillus daliensis TaxID=2892995 RepID=UPI001E3D13E4|nr:cytochrome-c oxidase [Brevibacillus daliensis]
MATRFIKIAVIYFVLAIVLGVYMGMTKSFQYASVHAHLNLLGWVSLALVGLIYHMYPQAARTKLASWHFWLHNLGLPIMQGSLFLMILTATESFVIGTIVGSIIAGVGVLFFAWNICCNVKR